MKMTQLHEWQLDILKRGLKEEQLLIVSAGRKTGKSYLTAIQNTIQNMAQLGSQRLGQTKWEKTFTFIPKRSISGKLIVGGIYKRCNKIFYPFENEWWQVEEYATRKEVFVQELRRHSNGSYRRRI